MLAERDPPYAHRFEKLYMFHFNKSKTTPLTFILYLLHLTSGFQTLQICEEEWTKNKCKSIVALSCCTVHAEQKQKQKYIPKPSGFSNEFEAPKTEHEQKHCTKEKVLKNQQMNKKISLFLRSLVKSLSGWGMHWFKG